MPTGGMPGGQGGFQPTTFATSTTSSPGSQGSGSGQDLGGAARWGSKSREQQGGRSNIVTGDDECEANS